MIMYCDGTACDNPDTVDDENIICTGQCEHEEKHGE